MRKFDGIRVENAFPRVWSSGSAGARIIHAYVQIWHRSAAEKYNTEGCLMGGPDRVSATRLNVDGLVNGDPFDK